MAKNLVLSGANLTIVDNKLIDEYDVDTNFFFGNSELGQSVRYKFIHYWIKARRGWKS